MRRLAVVSALLIAGCAGAPQQRSNGMAVAVPPPAALYRPWLVPRPSDEIVLFDTRMLQAMRQLDETDALNANGTGRVKRPGVWIAVGLGAVALVCCSEDTSDLTCELGVNCH
jgi:hypothetical protein